MYPEETVFDREAKRYACDYAEAFRTGLIDGAAHPLPAYDGAVASENAASLLAGVGEPVWTGTEEWGHLARAGRNASQGLLERAVLCGIDAFFASVPEGSPLSEKIIDLSISLGGITNETTVFLAIHDTIRRRFDSEEQA
ncbi:MAG: hypothetical protein WCO25_03310 [Candidatus Uhrbacteria bacterium]